MTPFDNELKNITHKNQLSGLAGITSSDSLFSITLCL